MSTAKTKISFLNIEPIHLEDKTFTGAKRCACCEKKVYEFLVTYTQSRAQAYCKICIIKKKSIISPEIFSDMKQCDGCARKAIRKCFLTGIDKSGACGHGYCKKCIAHLLTQVEELGGRLDSGFYDFISEPTRNSLPSGIRHEVFKRDNYKCTECGAIPNDMPLEIDHIIPVSRGGTDEIANLQTLCRICNREKSTLCFKGGNMA